MQVRLLGPVDVLADGQSRPVRGVRRTAVLAALGLRHGQVISIDQLVDVVWAQTPPPTAATTLQNHVSYLRQLLAGRKDAILARPPGYVLDLGSDGTDVQRAERLLRDGRDSADPAAAGRYLHAGLALWRGRPLAGLAGLPWLEQQAERLELLREHMTQALFEARLAAGEHGALVPDLEQLAADRPLDEQAAALLMLAFYRSGRQADALAAYYRLRQELDDELGIHPSRPLRDLEVAILRQDPVLDAPVRAGAVGLTSRTVPVPAQLPPAVSAFAGRRAELAALDAMLPGPGRSGRAPSGAMVISVLSGTAGVGKTALAVHWAHRVADRFPDGQLYVNLQGFDPGGAALEPAEAVRGFLEALGTPAARIPADLAGRAGLYRSLLAGRRVLVLLDNARDAEQVRPLLPGSPGCMAVVTGRDQLTGLIATDGAYPLTLDLLLAADARDLLIRRLGPARIAREPAAADDIIAGCARLPLALTIAAARAATRPDFALAAIAAELRQATSALDPFQAGDLASDVRAVFSWSYRSLSPAAARLFGLLGQHPGPDFSRAAAASLAGLAPDRAGAPLAELTRTHLLAEQVPGRYAFHDLLRAYAAEQDTGDQDATAAAVGRVLDHYLHSARAAAKLIEPHLHLLAVAPPGPGTTVAGPATADDAMAWFDAEHATLLAAVHLAAEAGYAAHAWQLAWTLTTAFLRRGSWNDSAQAQRAALAAARRAGDAAGEAHASHALALGYARSGRFDEAGLQFRQALRKSAAIGDRIGQAAIHISLTWLAERDDRLADALGHARQALELYRAADYQPGQAMVLNDIGFCLARLGHCQQALTYCEQGLSAVRELGSATGRPRPGTVSATFTISSAATSRPSPATSRPPTCTGNWQTPSMRPTRSIIWATCSTARQTRGPRARPGPVRNAFSTTSTIRAHSSSGPSCREPRCAGDLSGPNASRSSSRPGLPAARRTAVAAVPRRTARARPPGPPASRAGHR